MGRAVDKTEFVKICRTLEEAGAENINLVTGSHAIPRIASYLKSAREEGVSIPFCWNSSAYESVETLELLAGLVSVWLPDLKTLSPLLASRLFDAEDYPETASRTVRWMIDRFPLSLVQKTKDGTIKEKIENLHSLNSLSKAPLPERWDLPEYDPSFPKFLLKLWYNEE